MYGKLEAFLECEIKTCDKNKTNSFRQGGERQKRRWYFMFHYLNNTAFLILYN